MKIDKSLLNTLKTPGSGTPSTWPQTGHKNLTVLPRWPCSRGGGDLKTRMTSTEYETFSKKEARAHKPEPVWREKVIAVVLSFSKNIVVAEISY